MRIPRALWTESRWLALWAAMLGYLLDACDVMLYVFSIQSIRGEFGLSNQQAGLVASFTLITSAAGGVIGGIAADRIGRRKTLIYTILTYSLASAGTATSGSLFQLLFWRGLVGLGLGGEWAAGAVLVAESWPAKDRGKAISLMQSGFALGYMLAAVAAAVVLPRWGWRPLFALGVLPALLTLVIRRHVDEPEVWREKPKSASWLELFRGELRSKTIRATATASAVLLGYWGLFSWLPTFLASAKSAGGAGLGILGGSAWTFLVQTGSLAGYLSFGFLADRFGRRPAFVFYVLTAAALVPVYGLAPQWAGDSAERVLLVLGPFVGFFGSGYFSMFGSMLAELFPTAVRASGMGFCYNFGRSFSALAPFVAGAVADASGYGHALLVSSAFFVLAAALIFTLPETRDAELR